MKIEASVRGAAEFTRRTARSVEKAIKAHKETFTYTIAGLLMAGGLTIAITASDRNQRLILAIVPGAMLFWIGSGLAVGNFLIRPFQEDPLSTKTPIAPKT